MVEKDHSFWLGLQPFPGMAKSIDFKVSAYVTARPVPSEVTMEWLDNHGFPKAPIQTVGYGGSKVEILDGLDIKLFIDDHGENFNEINVGGKTQCLLFSRPWNREYEAGDLRIKSLAEVKAYARRTK